MRIERVFADDPGRHVAITGGRVFVHTGGRPPEEAFPLVVFLHGAGQDHEVWRAVADHMAAHAMSVANIDLPGHGATDIPGATSIAEAAGVVAEVIAASGHDAASLVGHSMGGLVALELAASRPDLVERLVLVGTGATMPVSERLLTAAAEDIDAANDMLSRWSHSRTVDDEIREAGSTIRSRTRPGVLHAALVACDRYTDGLRRAEDVAAPTLVVVGDDDVMVTDAEVDALVAGITGARLVTIPAAGHDVMLEAPGDVIDAIERFFADHRSSS